MSRRKSLQANLLQYLIKTRKESKVVLRGWSIEIHTPEKESVYIRVGSVKVMVTAGTSRSSIKVKEFTLPKLDALVEEVSVA